MDLSSGKCFRNSYADNLNAPILHRKELFLAPDHPRAPEFSALTSAEEQAGLYESTATIGFRVNWERLLATKCLRLEGHSLRSAPFDTSWETVQLSPNTSFPIHRHKTALTRYQLSKPVKTLLEYGQMPSGSSFLDYGCGLGADARGLRELGFATNGWDPVHAPDGVRAEADVVNLGYVINVIEDPAERLETLITAWRLARRLLVVSTLIGDAGTRIAAGVTHTDGVLTSRNTFQKYFSQQELQHYIEDALEATAVPVALGIFYIFRNPSERQLFLQSRYRRNIDWHSLRLGIEKTQKPHKIPRAPQPPRQDHFAANQSLLEDFWDTVLFLGRLPLPDEYSRYSELCEALASPKRVLKYLLSQGKQEMFDRARAARKADLLVYLSTTNLRRVIPFSCLPESVRHDINSFFGNYKQGLAEGRDLLYSAADATTVALACDDAPIGWQDERGLYLHTGLVDRLPTVLRVLVACAEVLYGNIHEADILKIHKSSGKLTFLTYANFNSALLPMLTVRTKVNLRTLRVDTFDHSTEGQLLYFKERFLDPGDAQSSQVLELSESLRTFGISESTFLGPRADEFREILRATSRNDLVRELGLESVREQEHDRDRA